MHNVLMDILFCKEKRNETFERFLSVESDLSYDWFTNYFQEEHSNRKSLMQDYTPDCICKIISGLIENKGNILDVCCGIGGLTISTWNTRKDVTYYCEELSDNSVALLLFNLSMRGMNAIIRHGNVLTEEYKTVYKLQKNGKFSDIEVIDYQDYKASIVISNPPYSLKWDDVEKYKDDKRFSEYGLPPGSKADYGFVLHGLSKLEEGGEAFFILPHGVLFRGQKESDIRKKIVESNVLDAIIGLPKNLFLNTQTPVVILVLKKNRVQRDVIVIDASKEYEKNGKQSTLTQEQIQRITDTYHNRKDIDKYSKRVSYEEIKENDYNLNIPRYVETHEEKEPINIQKEIEEIVDLEKQIHATGLELAEMLSEVVGGDCEYQKAKETIIEHLTYRYVHDTSEIIAKINKYMEANSWELSKHKKVKLLDIARIERSKKHKIYKQGSILIQLSATRGQMQYLNEDSEVESKYDVIEAAEGMNAKYLYYILNMAMADFLSVYQTGLNIVPEVFKHMKIEIHTEVETQKEIAMLFDKLEMVEQAYYEELTKWKNVKSYHIDNMFC